MIFDAYMILSYWLKIPKKIRKKRQSQKRGNPPHKKIIRRHAAALRPLLSNAKRPRRPFKGVCETQGICKGAREYVVEAFDRPRHCAFWLGFETSLRLGGVLWRHAQNFKAAHALIVGLSRPGAGKRGPKKSYWQQSPAYQGTQGSRAARFYTIGWLGGGGHCSPLIVLEEQKARGGMATITMKSRRH